MKTKFILGFFVLIISIGLVSSVWWNPFTWGDENPEALIGYEPMDNGTVIHIFNNATIGDYYFDVDSGIQLTNHYDDYWTKNVFCIGYYSGEVWNKISCADELTNFSRSIESDGETYVNATLWKDITYNGYDMRLGVQYHLGLNDKSLSVTVYGKNLGIDIPFDLGFAWKIKDVDIGGVAEDYIFINNTEYSLSDTYDLTFRNMTNIHFSQREIMINETTNETAIINITTITPISKLRIYDELNFLKLDWNDSLNYAVKMYGDGNPTNFYVATLINAGHFNPGQEKQTTFQWIDAAVPTHDNPILNTTDYPVNSTNANLISYNQSTADTDGDSVYNIYNWFRNDAPIMGIYLPMENVDGYYTSDYSGNLQNGTNSGMTFLSTGGINQTGAMQSTADNDFITLGDDLFETDNEGTIIAWVNITDLTEHSIILGDYVPISNSNYLMFYVLPSGSLAFQFYSDGNNDVVTSPILVSINELNHVAVTSDGSNYQFYFNGEAVTTNIFAGNNSGRWFDDLDAAGTHEATLGIRETLSSGHYHSRMVIDEARVYNRALTSGQINALYNNQENVIVNTTTAPGETWISSVTPNDGTSSGITKNSTSITILDYVPTHDNPILRATDHPINSTNANLTVYNQTTFDFDVDPVKNIHNWYVNNQSIMLLNMPFENSSATTLKDYSGYGSNGTEVGSPTWDSDGGFDNKGAYEFNGTVDFINITSPSYSLTDDGFSLEMWLKPTGGGYGALGLGGIYDSTNSAVTQGIRLRQILGGIDFGYGNGTGFTGTSYLNYPMTYNKWVHLVGVLNSTHLTLFVDGVYNNSIAREGTYVDSGNNIFIGTSKAAILRIFNGTIDDVRIWNSSLSYQQINALYNNRTDLIVSQETTTGENWTAGITVNDGFYDSVAKNSTAITIRVAPTEITDCSGDISSPGSYVLTNNITGAGADCIQISATGVILNCLGFYIESTNNRNDYGIEIVGTGNRDVEIHNCDLRVFDVGCYYVPSGAGGVLIEGSSSSNCADGGIKVDGSATINNFSSTDDKYGFWAVGGDNINITNSYFGATGTSNIRLENNGQLLIYNNIFNSTSYLTTKKDATIDWNITKTAGISIWGGTNFGGNIWTNPSKNGPSDPNGGCIDGLGDNICDSSYNISGDINHVDYLPLTTNLTIDIIPPVVTWVSPSNNTFHNGNVTLTSSATDTAMSSVEFWYQNATISATLLCTNTTGVLNSYSCNWNTAGFSEDNSGYQWTAVAIDIVGNSANTTPIITLKHDGTFPISKQESCVATDGGDTVKNGDFLTCGINVTDGSGSGQNQTIQDLTNLNGTGNVEMPFVSGGQSTGQWGYYEHQVLVNTTSGTKTSDVNISDKSMPNNVATATFTSIIVDNIIPTITLTNDTADSNSYNNTQVRFYSTGHDTYIYSYIFSSNATGVWVNESTVIYSFPTSVYNANVFKTLTTGNHSYEFLWFDEAGNMNQSGKKYFEILGNAPTFAVYAVSPIEGETITTTEVTFNYYYENGLADNCSLNLNYTLNETVNNPVVNITNSFVKNFSEGTHYYSIDCFNNVTNSSFETDTISFNRGSVAPTHGTPLLNATDNPSNTTNANLTAYNQSTFDAEGDNVKNIYNWYRNDMQIMALNVPFEGGSNSIYTKDYSGYGNDGTVTTATYNSTGGYDGFGAYEFNGMDDYIRYGDIGELENITAITVLAWFKPSTSGSSNNNKQIIAKWGAQNSWVMGYENSNNNLVWFGISNSTITLSLSTTAISNTNKWYHLVGRYNGTDVSIFVDGVQEDTDPKTGAISGGTDQVTFGSYSNQNGGLGGTIDDVQIYNSSLSDEQIFALYQNRTNLIVSQETVLGETWIVGITPNDGSSDGITKNSTGLTILSGSADPCAVPALGINWVINGIQCFFSNINIFKNTDNLTITGGGNISLVTNANLTISRVDLISGRFIQSDNSRLIRTFT